MDRCGLIFLAIGICVVLTWTTPAEACSCAELPGYFWVERNVPEVLLPSNARALAWWTGSSSKDAEAFRIERIEGEERIPIEHYLQRMEPCDDDILLLTATQGLEPGKRYRFVGPEPRAGDVPKNREAPITAIQVVLAGEALKSGRARLEIGSPIVVSRSVAVGASCSQSAYATQREVYLELPDEAKRFSGSLLYITTVGGRYWHPAPDMCLPAPRARGWQSPKSDAVFSVCAWADEPDEHLHEALEPNVSHVVAVHAYLPGTAVAFSDSKLVDLPCESRGCGRCGIGRMRHGSAWYLAWVPAWTTFCLGRRRQRRRVRARAR